ncbi:hypothetical protein SDC9_166653 [bioreactor metagenome]|uniref:Uncharacterized protein n=1 Tax=bioreactor metagenome TaxID=1076179 RepID=A0A645FZD6_9ZZZZ
MNPRKFLFDFPSNHIGYDLIQRHISKGFFQYESSIAHDCYCINNMLKFIQAMADIDDSAAFCLKLPDQGEELVYFHAGQSTGRFIHDQDFCIGMQSLGNFHHLLFGYCKIADNSVRINIDMK